MFGRKNKSEKNPYSYDRENMIPAIRASICTGEQTAGFRDNTSGKFTEVMPVRGPGDIEQFRREYGIEGEIKKIY